MGKPTNLTVMIVLLCTMSTLAYINPVQGQRDSPDPGVFFDGNSYYAVTTGGWDGHHFPIWESKDLFTWTQSAFVFPGKPSWAVQDFWAPEMHQIGKTYMIYYTARDETGKLCIGVASSDKPTGPYVDKGVPLLRNATEGVIDCTIHQENGNVILIYKVDGNAHGKPTEIYSIQLTANGKSLAGQNHLLFRDSLAWERGIVEAPWMVLQNGTYYIFYSSCGYADKCYSVGVARSKSIGGPYEKHPTPILFTRPQMTTQSW